MAMIAAAQKAGKPVDGHAPGLRGKLAARYAAAGITTDHECFTLGAPTPVRRDAHPHPRGLGRAELRGAGPVAETHPARVMLCCDDLHPDLLMVRHIDELVRRALRSGADRVDELRCVSVNPVKHYKLDVGLLRAGDPADFIVFEGWKDLQVRRTYLRGELVARDGRSLLPRQPSKPPNNFKARPRKAGDFVVKVGRVVPDEPRLIRRIRPTLNLIEAINGQLTTRHLSCHPAHRAGAVVDRKRDILKIAVVNRYEPHAPVAVAFIKGFGLKAGALASSVAHDSHDVVAVGVDDASLCAAINLVIKSRGGISVVGCRQRAVLPLPTWG